MMNGLSGSREQCWQGDGTHLIFERVAKALGRRFGKKAFARMNMRKATGKGALVPAAVETASLISIISDSWYDTIMMRANYQ